MGADLAQFDLTLNFAAVELTINFRTLGGNLLFGLLPDFIGGNSGLAFGDLKQLHRPLISRLTDIPGR